MKKALKIFITAALMLSICTGCTNPFSSPDEPMVQTANLFEDNGITQDDEINNGRCEDIFVESMAAALKSPNITIGVNFASSYGDSENLMNDVVLKLDYDEDKKSGSVYRLTNDNGTETKESGYYNDGYYYMNTTEGSKKVAEDFGTFLYQNDAYSTSIESSLISKFACVEHDGIKTYYMQYDPIAYENSLINGMEASSQPLAQDESITVNYANYIFDVDENNVMKSYTFSTNSVHKNSDEENNYTYTIKVNFSDMGSTKVDELTDLDTYEEISLDEYQGTDIAEGTEDISSES